MVKINRDKLNTEIGGNIHLLLKPIKHQIIYKNEKLIASLYISPTNKFLHKMVYVNDDDLFNNNDDIYYDLLHLWFYTVL